MPECTGPLQGLRVVELGAFIAGPFAGQLLGDYGAEVIKIEPPDGDVMRRWGVTRDGESLWWPTLARNKQSVMLDLREEADRDTARRLCLSADIVIENFAPGRLSGWGLDYASLSSENPRLIMAHVSGFGQDGPRATERGFGSIAEAMGGLRYLCGYPDRPPVRVGISLGDSVASIFAVIGVLAAIENRHRTGLGQEVDVALYEGVFALMESTVADYSVAGSRRERTGSTLAGVAPSNVYTAADGGELLIAANGDSLFQRLCKAMQRPHLATDPRYATHAARGERQVELDELIDAWTRSHPLKELETMLKAAEVPNGRVYTAGDILEDEQYRARGMIVTETADGEPLPVPMAGVVPKFSRTPGTIRSAGPALGSANAALAQTEAQPAR